MSNIDTRKALELARDALFAPMNTTKFHQAIAAIDAVLAVPAAPVAEPAAPRAPLTENELLVLTVKSSYPQEGGAA